MAKRLHIFAITIGAHRPSEMSDADFKRMAERIIEAARAAARKATPKALTLFDDDAFIE